MILLRLAFRNLWRNGRRTAITTAGIALGLALMMVSNNIAYGSYQDLVRTAVSMMAGHVVVQAEGYQEDPDVDRVVTDSTAVAAALRQALPDANVGRRLNVQGLLTSPTNAMGVSLRGVEPEREARVLELDEDIVEGEWLGPDDERGVLIGRQLASTLAVGLGDKVVFMAQPDGDEVESRLLRVRGIFHTGSAELDGMVAVVSLASAQALYQAPDPASQIAVHLDTDRATESVTATARQVIDRDDVEILPWQQAIPDILEFIELDRAYSEGIWFVLGLIVSMGVVNTVLMSVLERIREFGVMMAVGLKPRQLALMVLAEGLVLGLVGALVGMVLGLAFSYPLVVWGLDMSSMGESMETAGVPMKLHIFAAYDWARMTVYPLIGVGFAVLASLYPAWKVTRLSPIEAIQHQ